MSATNDKIDYIYVDVIIAPPIGTPGPYSYKEVPGTSTLKNPEGISEKIRLESANFISNSGIPVSLSDIPGMGAASGGPIIENLGLFLKIIKWLIASYKTLRNRTLKSRRKSFLPICSIILFINDLRGGGIPLVALIPDLQKFLSERHPALQTSFHIYDSRFFLESHSGATFSDTVTLKIIKEIRSGGQAIAVRPSTLIPRRVVKSFPRTSEGMLQFRKFLNGE